jgi:hypothetical protein
MAVKFILPLKGAGIEGYLPSSQIKSIPSAPLNSILALVVSNRVLLIKYLPLPPSMLKSIFSAALPWWVGITMGNPVIFWMVDSKRKKLSLPA